MDKLRLIKSSPEVFFLDAVLAKRVNWEAKFLIGRADSGVTNEAGMGLSIHHRRLM